MDECKPLPPARPPRRAFHLTPGQLYLRATLAVWRVPSLLLAEFLLVLVSGTAVQYLRATLEGAKFASLWASTSSSSGDKHKMRSGSWWLLNSEPMGDMTNVGGDSIENDC